MTPTAPPYHGSCLCSGVKYQVTAAIRAVSHCHCTMCRKAHGAAFGSYGSVPGDAHVFIAGEELLRRYASSAQATRTFCSVCGSPMLWQGKGHYADWVSFPLSTLDTPYLAPKQKHIHTASKAPWYDIADHWPQSM
ncbi:GFA family protein [Chitinolyticbacter albus]|uniref:GFA family protein n=1 Tax=Chitinolyticbacter albus TaxID=2961951 RepID=UPI00210CD2B7|nr:GFA family protein [Chitinolyticbacter albus]